MENVDSNGLEYNLNMVIQDLCVGIDDLAEKIKCGADREEVACRLQLLASTICNHWPDCFAKVDENSEAT